MHDPTHFSQSASIATSDSQKRAPWPVAYALSTLPDFHDRIAERRIWNGNALSRSRHGEQSKVAKLVISTTGSSSNARSLTLKPKMRFPKRRILAGGEDKG